MNVLYHLATLPPKLPQAEAISQEIAALIKHLGGDSVWINPNYRSPVHIPRLLFGFHKLKDIRNYEIDLLAHNFYNPDPFPFPYLRLLRRPVIYSITCGVRGKRLNAGFFSSLAAIAVPDERSLRRLQSWGLENVIRVHPGINVSRFTHSPLPLRSEIRLMVGSAPWTKEQFRTKGVNALLSAAQQAPRLKLVFLWRDVLIKEMERLVQQLNLEKQVTVLNELVDVNEVLAGVHASITLASRPGIVKSYPHSLLESLVAGKPVLISRAIPMADYVERVNCGKIVEAVTSKEVLTAVEALASDYEASQKSAQRAGKRDFSQEKLITSVERMYQRVR